MIRSVLYIIIFLVGLLPATSAAAESTGMTDSLKIGLVLSGGGAKGLAHIGVLKVIEESGLKVDYITGTSFGALVGALYAVGYSPDRIEEIILGLDWDELQFDRVSRLNVSIEEKDSERKFLRAFPIKQGKINLPVGLIAGQKLSEVLAQLFWSVNHVSDFNDFPIPFRCIATDIVSGERVVFDGGYICDALRASMSLPTIFIPIEVDGKLLVDGGIAQNLPATEVRRMGADIVIGVDVGAPLYQQDELNSLIKIVDQAISFQIVASTAIERKACDLLIVPDVKQFSTYSFEHTDEMIRRGEDAARQVLPELLDLAVTHSYADSNVPSVPLDMRSELNILDIEVQGLENVSRALLLSKLNIKPPVIVPANALDHAIARVYGSQYFERVTYRLEPVSSGVILIVRVVEQSTDHFKFGLHYDTDMKSALYLNTTFRNALWQGSKFMLDIKLSQTPAAALSYFYHTSWKPGIGFGVDLRMRNINPQIYDLTSKEVIATLEYNRYTAAAKLQTIVSNSFTIGTGLERQLTHLKSILSQAELPMEDKRYELSNLFGFLLLDTFNKSVFPTKGIKIFLEGKAFSEVLVKSEDNQEKPFTRLLFSYAAALPVSDRVTAFERLEMGSISGGKELPEQFFFLGGCNPIDVEFLPFVGLDLMEKVGKNVFIIGGGIQWEAWKNNYFMVEFDAGNIEIEDTPLGFEEFFDPDELLLGFGISFGYDSPIGPMEVSLSKSNHGSGLLTHVNIGFPF